MRELPDAYLQEMRSLLDEDFDEYLNSFSEPRYYGLRVNTLKISVEDFLKISPFPLEPVPWTDNGFYYREQDRPALHPYYYAGLYYLQEPSAMLPASVLPIESGDRVLDTCAAPGGKSTELAAKLNHSGILFSNDISNSRALALLKNLELFGVEDLVLLTEDLAKMVPHFTGYFDKILIDAPCSGEGMFRKDTAVIRSWQEHGHDFYISLQKSIVENALKCLKEGGYLLYSTCTFYPGEDEDMVLYMKSLCQDLHVVPVKDLPKEISGGLTGKAGIPDPELSGCMRIFPHRAKGEGHFAVLLRKGEESLSKTSDTRESTGNKEEKIRKNPAQSLAHLSDETREFLSHVKKDFSDKVFEVRNEKVYLVPEDLPSLSGLRILRTGLLLGEEKKNRFEPSQALAMNLKEEAFDFSLSFNADDPRILRYLKGETLDASDMTDRSGWVLICVDHFPLGFAKSNKGMLKNKYLKGWRYLS